MTTRQIPTEEQVIEWLDTLSNWGRWGGDDQLGTVNLITDAKRAQAAALVKEGISVTCSRLIVPEGASDVTSIPPLHYMLRAGDSCPDEGPGGTSDFIGFSFHGLTITHLDSLCHQVWNGKMYNGRPASDVNSETKANSLDIDKVQNGIVTRGVLLDIAKVKGKDWLEAGEFVFTEDLEAAEEAQGVRVEEGDALMLRLGWYKRRLELGPPASGRPGLHAETLPWLKERGVSLLGGDASVDAEPKRVPRRRAAGAQGRHRGHGPVAHRCGQLRGAGGGLRAAGTLGVHVQCGSSTVQERHRLTSESTGNFLA